MTSIGGVLIDGVEVAADEASVSIFNVGFQRGYGCFEAMRSYGGSIFRLDQHLARLQRSAEKMGLLLPSIGVVEEWARDRAQVGVDCTVRLLVGGGTDVGRPGEGTVVVVYAEPLHDPQGPLRLMARTAPWHPAGLSSELTGAKTLSYGPNLAVSLAAREAGFSDALLLGRGDIVLEGPTYSVAWIIDGTLETPELSLGILDSITRSAVLEIAPTVGLEFAEGRYALDRVLGAEEVVALSTLKEVAAVAAIGEQEWAARRWSGLLSDAFAELVAAETGAG
jgi:branched-chain amino acid aminotransferase